MHGMVRTAGRRAGVAGAVTGAALLATAGALPAVAWGSEHPRATGADQRPAAGSHTQPGHTQPGQAQSRQASAARPEGHNPPGNNGTVKIHDTAGDHTTHNVPHVSCTWWVDLFGFDNGQVGDISFAGQAPTGKDVSLLTLSDVELSPDDAGGAAHDWDSEFAFSASPDTSGATYVDLSALGAPAAQGYHVKLTVRTHQPGENAVKHKVFWVQPCTASGTTTAAAGEVAGTGAGAVVSGAGAQAPNVAVGAVSGAVTGTTSGTVTPHRLDTDVLGLSLTRPATTTAPASTGTEVLGLQLSRGGQLPFTGDNTLAALAAGVSSVAVGTALVAAGRRRRTAAQAG